MRMENLTFPAAAERLAGALSWGNVLGHLPLSPGYSLLEAAAPREMVGKSLRDSGLRQRYNLQVIGIRQRSPERFDLVPPADLVIKSGDVLVMIGRDEDLDRFGKLLG